MSKDWGLYWWVWFLAGFGIPEAIALLSGHPERTLSEFVWRTFQVDSPDPLRWTFLHYLLAVMMLWLAVHFVWRMFR
jgi:hypothetical protein